MKPTDEQIAVVHAIEKETFSSHDSDELRDMAGLFLRDLVSAYPSPEFHCYEWRLKQPTREKYLLAKQAYELLEQRGIVTRAEPKATFVVEDETGTSQQVTEAMYVLSDYVVGRLGLKAE